MCYLVPFIELSVSHASVLTILAITVERYYAICLPLQVSEERAKMEAQGPDLAELTLLDYDPYSVSVLRGSLKT